MRDVKVMITGADDNVRHADLIELSEKYPFVIWGILLSVSKEGTPRYPSAHWQQVLYGHPHYGKTRCVAHLCGELARDFKKHPPATWLRDYHAHQLNLAADVGKYDPDTFCEGIHEARTDAILQVRSMGDAVAAALSLSSRWNAATLGKLRYLIDTSMGTGYYNPGAWLAPHEALQAVGYAGGIHPNNVEFSLDHVWTVTRAWRNQRLRPRLWIDMESGVRTEDRFDLDKVRAVLETAAKWREKD